MSEWCCRSKIAPGKLGKENGEVSDEDVISDLVHQVVALPKLRVPISKPVLEENSTDYQLPEPPTLNDCTPSTDAHVGTPKRQVRWNDGRLDNAEIDPPSFSKGTDGGPGGSKLMQFESFDSYCRVDSNDDEGNQDGLIDNFVSSALRTSGVVTAGAIETLGSTSQPVAPNDDDVERTLMMRLLRADLKTRTMQSQHLQMTRIVCQLFIDEEVIARASQSQMDHAPFLVCIPKIRQCASIIIRNALFTIFFMALTMYAIFGPDLVLLYLAKDADESFAIANTVVFFLFCIELALQSMGRTHYVFSMSFALDVVSVISILGDTWLVKGTMFSGDGDQVSRMARSSRLTRLARIVRVARVTRLLPRLIQMCGRQRENLGRILLERRLWRSFLFLDQDFDNRIDNFDVKVFYLSVLTEGKHMLQDSAPVLLENDMKDLCKKDYEQDKSVDFNEFKRIILSTMMGKNITAFHIRAVDSDEGMWNLTKKLSDNTALKVCVGLLILIGIMSQLEIDTQDGGQLQGLIQAREEALSMKNDPANTSYMCDHLDILRLKYKVMFLHVEGKTYFENGICIPQGVTASVYEAFDRSQDVIKESPLRSSEIVRSCWPDIQTCGKESTTSLMLVDNSEQVDDQTVSSVLTITIVIVLLLVFVFVMNMGINNFSKTLLQPLRALVDDMTAMSALDLVHIDRDMPSQDGGRPTKVTDEVHNLQVACKSMRGAIKSWSKYVPPAVVQRLFASGVEAKIGVAKVTCTILFCDLADFEAVSRGLGPAQVLQLLEHALSLIAEVIARHRGTLLEFIGEEVLAVFNAPNSLKHHTYAGVASALEIHRVMSTMPPLKSSNGPESDIKCRCGVNTCMILAGNIGSSQRMKYGLLGDGINLTARIKGLNSRYQTPSLVSDKVYADERCKRFVLFRPVDLIVVKGKTEPTTVYEPLADRMLEEAPQLIDQVAQKHSQAFHFYKQRKFLEAKALFAEVGHTFKLEGTTDHASNMLQARCQHYIDNPPPANWDGAEKLTKK